MSGGGRGRRAGQMLMAGRQGVGRGKWGKAVGLAFPAYPVGHREAPPHFLPGQVGTSEVRPGYPQRKGPGEPCDSQESDGF